MRRFGSTALLTAVLVGALSAQAKPAPPPAPAKPGAAPAGMTLAGGVVGDVQQWKGVVLAVNQQSRHVVLKGPQGNLHAFTVKPDVPNLDKIAKGDTVSITFVEAIAVYLREASEPPVAATASETAVTPKGKPAIEHVRVKEYTVNVTAVDQKTRTLTVMTPQGNPVSFQVDPSVQAFSKVKVGDQIVVRATEAVAVAVTK